MLVRRFADLPVSPWRNGGGVTREVSRLPGGDGEFTARVSIAEVAVSGPFSAFDGIDRVIVQLAGPAMRLTLPDRAVVLRPGEPFAFDGGTPVMCEISAPTRDLNVMTRRGAASARLRVQGAGGRSEIGLTGWQAVVVALDVVESSGVATGFVGITAYDGPAATTVSDSSGSVALAPFDCAIVEAASRAVVEGPAAVVSLAGPPA